MPEASPEDLDPLRIPRHVGIVMDGNGRWATRRGLKRTEGHTAALTARNRRLTLTFAFNYGGRAEITDAVREIATEVAQRRIDPKKIDEKMIARHLYASDMPDPDLIVRTSGEYRLSNFLMWESAYSELVFTDVLFPDFRRVHLFESIAEFQRRDRRFGAIDDD